MSDITIGDGKRIRKETMECQRISHRTLPMEWQNQPIPTLEQQNNWEHCLKHYLLTREQEDLRNN